MNDQKIINRIDQVMAFSFCALIFFLPISIALQEIFAGAIQLCFFIKRGVIFYFESKNASLRGSRNSFLEKTKLFIRTFLPVPSYLRRPVSVFILAGFTSVILSQYHLLSFQGFFFKLLEWTFLCFIFIEVMTSLKRLKVFMGVFIFSALVTAVSGYLQQFIGFDFVRHNPFPGDRLTASFRTANDFGAYLIIAFSLMFNFVFVGGFNPCLTQDKKKTLCSPYVEKIFFSILLIVCFLSLGGTFSRGAWLGFFTAFIFLGVLWPKTLKASIPTIIIFLLFFFPQLELKRNVSFVSENVKIQQELKVIKKKAEDNGTKQVELGENVPVFGSGRVEFWKNSFKIIKDFPFGTGLNTYTRVSHDRRLGGYPHNCYLQLTAEMGFFGLFAFLWIIYALIWNSFKGIRFMSDKFLLAVLLGSLSGLIGFLAHSFVDTNFYSVQLGNLMWIMMGVCVAAQKIQFNISSETAH
ncbi:MAG: O-antigen ligase family protein [Candidatus Omnitrophota bacterium]